MSNKTHKINLFALVMITCAFVTSIRNLPMIAETGMKMLFFGLVASVCFFIPSALVSAELATSWPKRGGIYVWVKQAYGRLGGFSAIWLQWTYMTISVIAMLYFIAGSFAYLISPELANNKLFLVSASLIVIWTFTITNLRGMRISSLVSTVGFLGGVLFPGLFIIILGIIYILQGNPIHISFALTKENLLPDFTSISNLVLLVGFMRAFAGVEASASHAKEVENPKRNYPIAILIVVFIGIGVNVLGSMSVASVVPREQISLVAGVMEAFTVFFAKFNLKWMIPYLAFLVAMGQMGGVSTWLAGPVKGLLETARAGDLPPFFRKVNSKGMPKNLLILQAVIISLLSTGLMMMSSVNLAFWISVAMSMMIYVSMYFLMHLSALKLRYKEPKTERPYKVPFGKIGIWTTTCVGMITMVFCFFIAMFPPSELPASNKLLYFMLLFVGIVIVFAFPFIFKRFQKDLWRDNDYED